jgi:hypothetical protein
VLAAPAVTPLPIRATASTYPGWLGDRSITSTAVTRRQRRTGSRTSHLLERTVTDREFGAAAKLDDLNPHE